MPKRSTLNSKGFPLVQKLIRKIRIVKEKWEGVDFTRAMPNEKTGVPEEVGVFYAASDAADLRAILSELEISPEAAILDYGSGKGAAMRIMLEFPFKKVHGVELSDPLYKISKSNFSKLHDPRVKLFHKDARAFTDLKSYSHFYFYHPFPPEVMEKVLQNIKQSLKRVPRKITLIYYNPACEETFVSAGFNLMKNGQGIDHPYLIFENP